MKAPVLIAVLSVTWGCATPTYPPGSPQALAVAQHKTLMNECLAARADEVNEMAMIDPTYIYRSCRRYANSRVQHPWYEPKR